jgi:hypothetical protein
LEARLLSPFQSEQEVIFNAPLEAAWSFKMNLTKIPEFHPRVFKVDLRAGKTFRETGASYQCHLSGGKHTCIEKDSEIIPLQKIVTVLPWHAGDAARDRGSGPLISCAERNPARRIPT